MYTAENAFTLTISPVVCSTVARLLDEYLSGADSIHLKQCVTLYLFTLPFTLVTDLGCAVYKSCLRSLTAHRFTMIPVVTVVAFTLMGMCMVLARVVWDSFLV